MSVWNTLYKHNVHHRVAATRASAHVNEITAQSCMKWDVKLDFSVSPLKKGIHLLTRSCVARAKHCGPNRREKGVLLSAGEPSAHHSHVVTARHTSGPALRLPRTYLDKNSKKRRKKKQGLCSSHRRSHLVMNRWWTISPAAAFISRLSWDLFQQE